LWDKSQAQASAPDKASKERKALAKLATAQGAQLVADGLVKPIPQHFERGSRESQTRAQLSRKLGLA